jgi:hypothetical protein
MTNDEKKLHGRRSAAGHAGGDAMIALREGGRYRTADGRIAVVTSSNPTMSDGYIERKGNPILTTCWWTKTGKAGGLVYENRDIVEELPR